MAEKRKVQASIASQECITEGIYSMWLQFPQDYNMAAMAVAGQFVSLYSNDGSRLLPRPISICEIDSEGAKLRLVYRVAGAGTEEFSRMQPGECIEVVGPLGNGFTQKAGKAILIGGGIGIPPMLQLSKSLSEQGVQVQVVLGYRDENLFLKSEFEKYGEVYVSTEDGSIGVKGNVIDAIRDSGITADTVYACGPIPMLRGVKAYAAEHGIQAQISMEERMACGIGACLACVCQSQDIDGHSNVHNKRICKDGPVFDADEIVL
ncbi:MAG: dihydroorotate dehydrogenase electron transfer subunit [Lachnospiraceae bacterium]|nr:dihydroorotate dehydrogenase electron transfer subunit [Lachnospiraceae bacterium]